MKFNNLRHTFMESESSTIELEPGDLEFLITQIQEHLSNTEDLMTHNLAFNNQACALVYIESLVQAELLQTSVIQPLLDSNLGVVEKIVTSIEVKHSNDVLQIGKYLLNGSCIMVMENEPIAFMMLVAQSHVRNIQEPKSEQVIQGSHEGFIESLSTNIYLLRNRIRSPKFKVKYFTIGHVTNTKVAMIYIDHIANPTIIEECEKRLRSIDLDYLYSAGNIDEMIEEHPYSPFPQSLQTERPDRAVSYLMEGKINIVVDGSPSVLVLPTTFFHFINPPMITTTDGLRGPFSASFV